MSMPKLYYFNNNNNKHVSIAKKVAIDFPISPTPSENDENTNWTIDSVMKKVES
eukprot:CAMPEP_0176389932 /NCGR_PEP_ID=MMETSP0126-20121128/38770_1 /TAXON_ID=141414 ORGANISM="Strombidinopsis acuminatum, Strain SPMC142" /NCGR_SAMPLE_ID=MMETSP0126 /ASSEMBLY_ACC=CAM_ASM_000229 /LENGTH=53 /DNA_ID=CAMNT_0017759039 /DNA_START=885 /DNA_END=1046 /DNA_ORIENTATION=-